MHFKVIFNLDGRGVCCDPFEPTHLDALLAWSLAPMQSKQRNLGRDDVPDDIQLPFVRSRINGYRLWHASALFPEGASIETLRHWRKRFRQDRIELTSGSPNLTNGIYREYNAPVPLLLVPRMVAYASGNRKEVKKLLRKWITSLGRKRAHGHGQITSIDCEETHEDWSFVKDGKAARWLPQADAIRLVRTSPPYWNSVDRIPCCEVGDKWPI